MQAVKGLTRMIGGGGGFQGGGGQACQSPQEALLPFIRDDDPKGALSARRGRWAPSWVRQMPGRDLHAIAGRFVRDQRVRDLTSGQEWLLAACFNELEWRRRNTYPVWRSCSCEFCVAPF